MWSALVHLAIRHRLSLELLKVSSLYKFLHIIFKSNLLKIIFFCHFRTLFNCGEGTFRILYSRSHRFRSFSNVFCTSNRWERIGGIPSLGRAVFDRNSHFPTIHGPQQIENCLNTFAALTDIEPELAVSDRTFNQNTYYEDNHMQVDFVDLIRENAPTTEIPSVKAYVCRLIPRGGTVMLSKFTEDQIPVEYIKNISKGEDVTLPDGRSIIAKDFISPGFEGGNFLGMQKFFFSVFL